MHIELFQVMHEELALQWVISGGAAREMAFLNSWFFLELMVTFLIGSLVGRCVCYIYLQLIKLDQYNLSSLPHESNNIRSKIFIFNSKIFSLCFSLIVLFVG